MLKHEVIRLFEEVIKTENLPSQAFICKILLLSFNAEARAEAMSQHMENRHVVANV